MTLEAMAVPESHAVVEFDPVTKDPRVVQLHPFEGFWNADRTEFVCNREVSRRWVQACVAGPKADPELVSAIENLDTWHYEPITGVDAEQFQNDDTIKWMEACDRSGGEAPRPPRRPAQQEPHADRGGVERGDPGHQHQLVTGLPWAVRRQPAGPRGGPIPCVGQQPQPVPVRPIGGQPHHRSRAPGRPALRRELPEDRRRPGRTDTPAGLCPEHGLQRGRRPDRQADRGLPSDGWSL